MGEIARAGIITTGRFHHSIAAFATGAPFVSASSNAAKTNAIMQILEKPEPLPIRAPDLASRLIEAHAAALDTQEHPVEHAARLEAVIMLAQENYAALLGLLFQAIAEAFPVLLVGIRVAHHVLRFLWRESTHHLARRAHHERVIRNFLTFRDKRLSANQAAFPYFGAIQHHGPDADQRAFADGAAVQHNHMANRNIPANIERVARVRMQNGAILNI